MRGVAGARARAEALTRFVNATVQKKPTVSLPSAREVLRTRIGDCNEHTALFVAMSRAIGIPARIAVGLAFVRGAFYYHAWPEIYLDEGGGAGAVAAGRSDVQPVSGRRHALPARARRPRQAGRDYSADRPSENHAGRRRGRRRKHGGARRQPNCRRRAACAAAPTCPPSARAKVQARRQAGGACRASSGATNDHDSRACESNTARSRRSTASTSTSRQGEIHGFLGPNGARKNDVDQNDRRPSEANVGPHLRERSRSRGGARGREGVARLHSRPALHLREADRAESFFASTPVCTG